MSENDETAPAGKAGKVSKKRVNRRAIVAISVGLVLVVIVGLLYSQRALIGSLLNRQVNIVGGDAGTSQLTLPPGFSAQVYASGLHTPRFMAVGPDGVLYVTESGSGEVVALRDPQRPTVVASGLRNPTSLSFSGNTLYSDFLLQRPGETRPTSLSFSGNTLYIGETDKVRKLTLDANDHATSNQVIIDDLPPTGEHITRTVLFGPDGKLYVAIGSSCNVCDESDPHRASVWVYNADGSDGHRYSYGLRNAVGLAVNPWNEEVWATNNGRDLLGDDIPPDTVYALQDGGNYGWPRCHAGDIVDPDMGQPGDCDGILQPLVKIQAHSAPLGLAFYNGDTTGQAFPSAWRGLFVALHGSWNRSAPTGYKLIFIPLDANGHVSGPQRDFATGWLAANAEAATGRPVGLTVAPDGALYVSDDKAGLVYRISYSG